MVGTRPNFIKITQFKKVNQKLGSPFDIRLLHTGQHYDDKMADVFFRQFDLQPDFFLNIPQATANTQMAEIMLRLEKTLLTQFMPDLMMVVGDVNSTFAAALTANKMGIKFAHIESGLRSNDRSMPEEHNRILTDAIADFHFVTEQSGHDYLIKEGRSEQTIFFTGNTMIDTLVAFDDKIADSDVLQKYHLTKNAFALMTMHRPATVDFKEGIDKLLSIIEHITALHPLFFAVHPRTFKQIETFGFGSRFASIQNLFTTDPLDYFSFQKLIGNCIYVITDSGGIQEETTYCRVPCLTLRDNTERPSTVEFGTNQLVPFDVAVVNNGINSIVDGTFKKGSIPPLWDGAATQRILEVLVNLI